MKYDLDIWPKTEGWLMVPPVILAGIAILAVCIKASLEG